MPTVETSVNVRCRCGDTVQLSRRRGKGWQHRPGEYVCRPCQRAPREPAEAERDRYQRWWLARYSLEELQEIGRALWPGLTGGD